MKVVIPAAGAGKRFASQGFTSPKELLPLGGRPLIAHALLEAKRAGFESALVVVAPAKESLIQYLVTASLPLPVEMVVQPLPAGIGDAVVRCWRGEPFGVLLPDDVVLETKHWTDLLETHRRTGAAALCVRPVAPETVGRFGIAECAGDRVVRLLEKPAPGTTTSTLAIFGRYIANEAVVEATKNIPVNGELELTYGFAGAIATPSGVRAVHFGGRTYDCGTPADYALATDSFPA